MIRVAIIAAAPAVRAGLQVVLEADPQLTVVGSAEAPPDDQGRAVGDADVVVAYRVLPDWLFQPPSALRGLLLLSDDWAVLERLSGVTLAWGALPEDATPAEIGAAVVALAQGLIVVHPHVVSQLLGTPGAMTEAGQGEPLTGREREVLQLLGQGLSNRQIAGRLGISEHTIKFHVSAIYAKLGVASRAEAVRVGARRGLLIL